jgi:hypothetical protein
MNCQQADSGVSYWGVVANATSIDIYCEIATGSNNRKFGHTTGLVAGQYVAAEVDPLKACRCAPIGAPSQLCSLGRLLTNQRFSLTLELLHREVIESIEKQNRAEVP